MAPYEHDAAWERGTHYYIRGILAGAFGIDPEDVSMTQPQSEDDRHWNTDAFVRLPSGVCRVALRNRRAKGPAAWQGQFTLRYSRPSGTPTEWDKLLAGRGDFMYYGFANGDHRPFSWIVADLSVFRSWLKSHIDAGTEPPCEIKDNKDGSSRLIAFYRGDLPPAFIVAQDPAQELVDAMWAIVTAKPRMTSSAYRWARAGLGLDE